MTNQTISYQNIKYNFKCIMNINSLSKHHIVTFQKLYYSKQISEQDYNNLINTINELN